MIKTITMAALAVVGVTASAQGWEMNSGHTDWPAWRAKYDTYAIASTDLNGISEFEQWRILRHEERTMPPAKAYDLNRFLDEIASPDQQRIVLKALTANFKEASAIRDEVAMARFGKDDATYAWLAYPPLTWGDQPGQNSWASLPTPPATTVVVVAPTAETEIAMTEDSSRPMRMVMRQHGWRDIDYDQAIDILGAPLDDYDRAILDDTFHPWSSDPMTYTNNEALDAMIYLINQNADMCNHLDRYAWYNHYDKDYYTRDIVWVW